MIQERIDEVRASLPEGYDIALERTDPKIIFTFKVPNMPKVDKVAYYMALNYTLCNNGLPGIAKFNTEAEALAFLDKFAAADADYEKVIEFAHEVHCRGWMDAIYAYVDEWTLELPAERDGAPSCLRLGALNDADLVTTVGQSSVYGSLSGIPTPSDNGAAILVEMLVDGTMDEAEVEMSHIFDLLHIAEDSLEEALALQLIINLSGYAYVPYSLIGGVWLLPTPENLEFLEEAIESEAFKKYYETSAYDYERGAVNERQEAIAVWLDTVVEEIANWSYSDEELAEFDLLLNEWEMRPEEDYV